MGGGIMNVVPREKALLGGIKKAVKKVTKGVKDIAKSDVGKAALLAAGAYALGGSQFLGGQGIFKAGQGLQRFKNFANLPSAISGLFTPETFVDTGDVAFKGSFKTSPIGKFFSSKLGGNVGKLATLGAVTTFLTSTLGMTEEQAAEELARDPSGYLEQYYRNLNPPGDKDPEVYEAEVREFVTANTSEYAVGGRVGFANGPVLPPDPTQPVNPFGPKPEDFGIEEDIPIKMASNIENDKILEALFEKYLDMGLSPKEAAEAAQKEFERMSMMKTEEGRGLAALGGRMNFDKGTPMGLQGLGSLMDEDEEMVVIIDYDEDGNPRLIRVPKSEAMKDFAGYGFMKKSLPVVVDDKMDSGEIVIPIDKEKILEGIVPRDNKAKGDTASDNAMQAAGVEGLPIRQNPKGVKELDLRETGGFIQPVGIKEKADDIPAMLSNNEFVFTADAVRGAGGGNVNLGAQRMYDMMKKLEAGGRV
jgi:hypothetical protein